MLIVSDGSNERQSITWQSVATLQRSQEQIRSGQIRYVAEPMSMWYKSHCMRLQAIKAIPTFLFLSFFKVSQYHSTVFLPKDQPFLFLGENPNQSKARYSFYCSWYKSIIFTFRFLTVLLLLQQNFYTVIINIYYI